MPVERKLVAALACRNQGSRLYGKPLQNLDIDKGYRIIDTIIGCLQSVACIDEIILGISEGTDNLVFQKIAEDFGLRYIVGDQIDVLSRLIACGDLGGATDIFRVTSESPFLYFEDVEDLWRLHVSENRDATMMDDIIDGCGFEFISLEALKISHHDGEDRHRSELCTLYIRENLDKFSVNQTKAPDKLNRKDLRLTVDYPEDLVVCRAVYQAFAHKAPRIPVAQIVDFLDANPHLIEITAPFTEAGYQTMYVWDKKDGQA